MNFTQGRIWSGKQTSNPAPLPHRPKEEPRKRSPASGCGRAPPHHPSHFPVPYALRILSAPSFPCLLSLRMPGRAPTSLAVPTPGPSSLPSGTLAGESQRSRLRDQVVLPNLSFGYGWSGCRPYREGGHPTPQGGQCAAKWCAPGSERFVFMFCSTEPGQQHHLDFRTGPRISAEKHVMYGSARALIFLFFHLVLFPFQNGWRWDAHNPR